MSRSEKKPVAVDRTARLNRLAEVGVMFANKATFKVGDLITHNPALYGPNYNAECEAAGVHPVMLVLDTHTSWREVQIWQDQVSFEYSKSIPESQAIFIAHEDAGGSIVMRWVNAWAFMLAPEELLKATPGGSLNH